MGKKKNLVDNSAPYKMHPQLQSGLGCGQFQKSEESEQACINVSPLPLNSTLPHSENHVNSTS